MNPILSIIIPCYNSEKTLEGTLYSILEQSFDYWEAIIINDGSIDATENIALNFVIKDNRFKYYSKKNEGLGKTRNYGIAKARGEYILPLDSDNQIIKGFVDEAIVCFKENEKIGVIHGNAEYFGQEKGFWLVEKFDLSKILAGNYIDACAIYRKALWEKVGGYDENMPFQGYEDWDFWIALGILNVDFYHLNKITFRYYVVENSMIRSFTEEIKQCNNDYIFKKYSEYYQKYYFNVSSKCEEDKKEQLLKLKSKKYIINLFFKTFFGFEVFKKFKTGI